MDLTNSPGRSCGACFAANASSARFCSSCGTKLPELSGDGSESAERRQLTVLFADLVGSTRLAAMLDPEDWRNTVRAYQQSSAAVVARYEGHVAQYLGDGILVYFGFPQAHEDDAERSMRAGLEIVAAVKDMTVSAKGESLAVRVGIHTGQVVVGRMGSGGSEETLAVGHATNVAARLQGLALPNTVVVSEDTRRLASGQFLTRDLGFPDLKGIDKPLRAHTVLQPSGVRSRLAAAGQLTPFVGRQSELDLLIQSWSRTAARQGQVALVGGEAGVGKSRLVLALRQHMAHESHTWLEAHCSPYGTASAFAPIRALIEQGLQFQGNDSDEVKLNKLTHRLAMHSELDLDTALPIMAAFLEIAGAPLSPGLSPEALREQTLSGLVDWGTSMAADQPVLLLVEDMHWCDPSSLEFIARLVERLSAQSMLVLMTSRPGFRVPWLARPNAVSVVLGGLARADARVMVESLCADSVLTGEAYERIVARADGVPLHVEELTKMLQASASSHPGEPVDDIAIPETLEGSLMARLDQLNEAKRVAHAASVLGREFDIELLQAVSRLDRSTLDAALQQLLSSGLLFTRQADGGLRYVFKHALIQDASYASLLKSRRRDLHKRAALAFLNLLPALAARQPELVARHFMEAEDWQPAARQWLAAGLSAVRSSANLEAIAYLQAGLKCVKNLDDPAQRAPLDLDLLLSLGPPLMATRGYADPDVEAGYSRARELCRQLGEPPAVFPVLFGLWTYHCLRAKHVAGLDLAHDMAKLASASGDPGHPVEADLAMGANLFYLGRFEDSCRHLAQSIAAYDPQRDEAHRYIYGQDPQIGAHGYEPLGLWLLGRGHAALASSDRELALARDIDHPFSQTYALTFAAWFHRMRGDVDRCGALAQELLSLATERGVALYRAVGIILAGSVQCERGELEQGLPLLEQGMAEYRQTGSSVILPYWEGLHADALRRAGKHDDAQAALDRGFEAVRQTGERWCEAELVRYGAELLAGRGGSEQQLEAAFEAAVAAARSQGAWAWELRATLGLFRHAPSAAQRPPAKARLHALLATCESDPDNPELAALHHLIATNSNE